MACHRARHRLPSSLYRAGALHAVAIALGFPQAHEYNDACRNDPEDVQRRIDAL